MMSKIVWTFHLAQQDCYPVNVWQHRNLKIERKTKRFFRATQSQTNWWYTLMTINQRTILAYKNIHSHSHKPAINRTPVNWFSKTELFYWSKRFLNPHSVSLISFFRAFFIVFLIFTILHHYHPSDSSNTFFLCKNH